MCELLAVSSSRPIHLTFSLETLASHSSAPGNSRDGWGAAFYQGNDVALFREPAAAFESPLVHFLEEHGPATTMALSHIRHATRGPVALANTQPFVRESAGRSHAFAHNGTLKHVHDLLRSPLGRFHPIGATDSEYAFCALMERIGRIWGSANVPSVEDRLALVAEFAAEIRTRGPANFLYSDGEVLFAHGHRRLQADGSVRPPGLWKLQRHCSTADEPLVGQGVSIDAGYQDLLLVASVPLSDAPWEPLAEGDLLAIKAGRILETMTVKA